MLPPGTDRVTVGRRADQSIALPWDGQVSRAHALLDPVGDHWTLVDEGATNGTFVNGAKIAERRALKDRDRMCFGDTPITYREPADADSASSTARAVGSPANAPVTEKQREVLIALCRPMFVDESPTPATNRVIAGEIYLSEDAVKAHMRGLFARFGYEGLPQNEKRARLARAVIDAGIISPRDY
jgi:pSer/pThr/pTyr-binding forkhead associated (FHA) protein